MNVFASCCLEERKAPEAHKFSVVLPWSTVVEPLPHQGRQGLAHERVRALPAVDRKCAQHFEDVALVPTFLFRTIYSAAHLKLLSAGLTNRIGSPRKCRWPLVCPLPLDAIEHMAKRGTHRDHRILCSLQGRPIRWHREQDVRAH